MEKPDYVLWGYLTRSRTGLEMTVLAVKRIFEQSESELFAGIAPSERRDALFRDAGLLQEGMYFRYERRNTPEERKEHVEAWDGNLSDILDKEKNIVIRAKNL